MEDRIHILFIGDIVGRPGRAMVEQFLPRLRRDREIHFVIANAENAAGGKGLTQAIARSLYASGIDVLTGGNHIWTNRDVLPLMDSEERLLRPANYPHLPDVPGRGAGIFPIEETDFRIGVVNLLGRAFMTAVDNPFPVGLSIVEDLLHETPIVLVDFHAEATSEKIAMGWYLDGMATAVLGTHTHVPTADEMVTPNGTAMQTDVGMTGSFAGVIGVRKDIILHTMLTQLPVRHELAEGDNRLCATLVHADPYTGRALEIERICLRQD